MVGTFCKREVSMEQIVGRVMEVYAMMHNVSGEEMDETKEQLVKFLEKQPPAQPDRLTVAGLTYLHNLKH